MTHTLEDLKPYRSQHLILLIGSNPLPNWVAARLLYPPPENNAPGRDGQTPLPTLWLLHSYDGDHASSTKEIAQRLKSLLAKQFFPQLHEDNTPIHLRSIPSSDANGITRKLREISDGWRDAQSIGLNYTGGTKAMAVHVYRFLEAMANDQNARQTPRMVYSYVDPRHTMLRIDGKGTDSIIEFPILQSPRLRERVTISLQELAALHGYDFKNKDSAKEYNTSEDNPLIYDLACAIGRVYAAGAKKHWITWIKDQPKSLPDGTGPLREVAQAMTALAQSAGQPCVDEAQAVANALMPCKNKEFRSCYKWFLGTWLEEYASHALLKAKKSCPQMQEAKRDMHFVQQDQRTNDDFQLDAAGMLGYQLFALSCTTAGEMVLNEEGDLESIKTSLKKLEKKNTSKEHLMEIYVRARQLGGDEARIGLICFYDSPQNLEAEIRQSWDTEGRVKVFTQSEIGNLEQAFADWFTESLSSVGREQA